MWPAEHLKVVNNDSLEILQDYVVDCEYVDFYSSSDDKLLLYGYRGSSLRIIPTENPDETQVCDLFQISPGVFNSSIFLSPFCR